MTEACERILWKPGMQDRFGRAPVETYPHPGCEQDGPNKNKPFSERRNTQGTCAADTPERCSGTRYRQANEAAYGHHILPPRR
eukprot:scaffold241956_cov29-Tisochrysis_lutea.AAC.8